MSHGTERGGYLCFWVHVWLWLMGLLSSHGPLNVFGISFVCGFQLCSSYLLAPFLFCFHRVSSTVLFWSGVAVYGCPSRGKRAANHRITFSCVFLPLKTTNILNPYMVHRIIAQLQRYQKHTPRYHIEACLFLPLLLSRLNNADTAGSGAKGSPCFATPSPESCPPTSTARRPRKTPSAQRA